MMSKLLKFQTELKAPKGQFNKFGNYKYRSCEDILEALKPLLAREGCTLTLSDEIVEIGGRVYDWFNLDYVLYIALAIEAVLFWVTGKSLSMKIKSVTQENLKASESLS